MSVSNKYVCMVYMAMDMDTDTDVCVVWINNCQMTSRQRYMYPQNTHESLIFTLIYVLYMLIIHSVFQK